MSDASADAPGICGDGPVLDAGRETCGRLDTAEPRQWLCANGVGEFASGTVAGLLTVNALWYNALRAMGSLARVAGRDGATWDQMAGRAAAGFDRFWNEAAVACHDVIDGPAGADPTLRPNQIFAVSRPASPLLPERQRRVVDICARQLLTSFGPRSLAPGDSAHTGHYGGGSAEHDGAYHQGPAWGWLLGPFALAHLRVYGDRQAARAFLAPKAHHLGHHGLGSIAEIFEGDAPFASRGAIAQAWSVAETLRAWCEIGAAGSGRPA